MSSRVFVTQETLRVNQATGELQQFPSLRPAESFGKVRCLLGWDEAMDLGPDVMVWKIRERLADFGDGDYILPLGSPMVMGLAIALAAEMNDGRVRILQWSRESGEYQVREMDLNAQPRNGEKR
jgi:hypothetical protein